MQCRDFSEIFLELLWSFCGCAMVHLPSLFELVRSRGCHTGTKCGNKLYVSHQFRLHKQNNLKVFDSSVLNARSTITESPLESLFFLPWRTAVPRRSQFSQLNYSLKTGVYLPQLKIVVSPVWTGNKDLNDWFVPVVRPTTIPPP